MLVNGLLLQLRYQPLHYHPDADGLNVYCLYFINPSFKVHSSQDIRIVAQLLKCKTTFTLESTKLSIFQFYNAKSVLGRQYALPLWPSVDGCAIFGINCTLFIINFTQFLQIHWLFTFHYQLFVSNYISISNVNWNKICFSRTPRMAITLNYHDPIGLMKWNFWVLYVQELWVYGSCKHCFP